MSIYKGTTKISGVGSYHPPLLQATWSDHIINDIQWLRADTFSWQDGGVYEVAYDHLESDIEDKTLQAETIGSITINYYLADDGHKICPSSEESSVLSLYNTYGIAWYFIIDTLNERFKLPRTKYGFEGLRDSVGNKIDESLPNIEGSIYPASSNHYYTGVEAGAGAFQAIGSTNIAYPSSVTQQTQTNCIDFNASRSSSTYQDNAPVQERATQMYLYFYVGQFTQSALSNTAGITSEILNAKMDNNLANTDALTNCILEDPQNINLELSNGTLTLKAGSVVCVPNGFESDGTTPKFDEVTIGSDVSDGADTARQAMIYLKYNKSISSPMPVNYCTSGSSAPTSFINGYALWYDTTNNLVKFTSDSGSTWTSGNSFPFAIATETTTAYTSIDQTFQSIGYIGSTVFVRKGLKGLATNGRNDDGSLNSLELTTDTVLVDNYFNSADQKYFVGVCKEGSLIGFARNGDRSYDETNNHIYNGSTISDQFEVCSCTKGANGVISNFKPYTATNILKYSDSSQISGWGMPSSKYTNLTLGASGATYTAPANGWIFINGTFSQIEIYNNTSGGLYQGSYLDTSRYCGAHLPAKKGDSLVVIYNGTKNNFKFVYAEGEQS